MTEMEHIKWIRQSKKHRLKFGGRDRPLSRCRTRSYCTRLTLVKYLTTRMLPFKMETKIRLFQTENSYIRTDSHRRADLSTAMKDWTSTTQITLLPRAKLPKDLTPSTKQLPLSMVIWIWTWQVRMQMDLPSWSTLHTRSHWRVLWLVTATHKIRSRTC